MLINMQTCWVSAAATKEHVFGHTEHVRPRDETKHFVNEMGLISHLCLCFPSPEEL